MLDPLSPSDRRRRAGLHGGTASGIRQLKCGEYSTAELGDLFGVAWSTVYRAIGREAARQRAERSDRLVLVIATTR